jgi:type VI secretion system protein ImpB
MAESVHKKLERVRKPRVHIKYDVETEGAVVEKELPFVMGVMGDFSGDPTRKLEDLRDRKFVQIDRDNFDKVLERMAPGLNLKVANKLTGEGDMGVSLKFSKMDDFEPARIVEQVEPLKRLQETREKLRELMTKADRSEDLEHMLEDILKDKDALAKLSEEIKNREGGQ